MATLPTPNTMIYGDVLKTSADGTTGPTGPMYSALYNSGFSTVVLYTLFVHDTGAPGDLVYAAEPPIASNGTFDPQGIYGYLQDTLAALKTGGSVRLVVFSIGTYPKGGIDGTFSHIQKLLQSPSGRQVLEANFAALMEALPAIDGFVFDDEDNYDVDTVAQLAQILTANGTNGKLIAFCPYTRQGFWAQCMRQIHANLSSLTGPSGPATVQPVAWWNVQCYSPGGSPNIPILGDWVTACMTAGVGLTGSAAEAFIVPGLGAPATPPMPPGPAGVQNQFAAWSREFPGLGGGFIYDSAGMQPGATQPPSIGYTMQQYASAISAGLQGVPTGPTA